MNYLGGGIIGVVIVPVVIIVAFLIARRPWAAVFFTVAILASSALVQVLKNLVGRSRPEDILVVSDYGSFPSGHTANAATMAVVFGLVFGRLWIWAAGILYTAMMAFSRTYLGAHWLSDTIGGILIGAGVAVIVWAPFASRLEQERERHRRDGVLPGGAT
jgi:undecaprenyl-diphosphatase